MFAPYRAALPRFGRGLLLGVIRPILRFHLAAYEHEMKQFPFPQLMNRQVPGANATHIFFVGDIAVAGYGVLFEGMALPAQTVQIYAARRLHGCTWAQVSQFDLTAKKAVSEVVDRAVGADVAVIALGIPDVLLVSDADEWVSSLRSVVSEIRGSAGDGCRIVFTGIPPMEEFQPIPPLARRLIARQVRRLNVATQALSAGLAHTSFVPFPDWGVKRMYARDVFSYRTMHRMWAQAIVPHLESSSTQLPAASAASA